MKSTLFNPCALAVATGLAMMQVPLNAAMAPGATGYLQINLVSDNTNAARVDTRLLNPWGIIASTQALWVNDNHSGLMTVYGGQGRPNSYAVNIPAPGGGPGAPTGLVFNDTDSFVITNGSHRSPADFLMSTEDGTITAWAQRVSGTNATIVVDNSGSGAIYKGLAIARGTNGAPQIYGANFHAGVVDIYDANFQFVSSFTDALLPTNTAPAKFAPFNVKTIRGKLFVTFALQKLPDAEDDQAGPGNGFVDIFDTDGTLLRQFAAQGPLNSPWGMAVAPRHFGEFSGALLIGNFGDGRINAYELLTGKFLGQLSNPAGDPIFIPGLWGLTFERDERPQRECEFEATRLFFTAGPNDEEDGLLGYLRALNPSNR